MLTEQQQIAAHSVDKNVLVSAGAGSGKTHVLVERYVEILRKFPGITLSNIVAVTFTRKAAFEMRSRLKARFLKLSKDPQEGDHQRWLDCLAEVDSARIGTIHSQCESILKAYPADSGIDPEFEVLDELTSTELAQDAVTHALRIVIAGSRDSYEYKLLSSDNIESIQSTLQSLIKASMQFEEALKVIPDLSVEGLLNHAKNFIMHVQRQELAALRTNREFRRACNYIEANPHADPKNALENARQVVLSCCGTIFSGEQAEAWKALEELATFTVGNVGGNKPEPKALRAQLKILKDTAKDALARVPQGLVPEDDLAMEMILGMVRLYELAKTYYDNEKTKRTALDYNDLIGRARLCLSKEGSQARSYFNDKVKALLVDEFQDTNHVQAELLMCLAGPETRVFFIGDDKQSIYKFQGADVATFNLRKQSMGAQSTGMSGESLVTQLTKSFRSHPDVVAFVNEVFSQLLDGDPAVLPYVAAFEALEPARTKPEPPEGEMSPAAIDVVLFDPDPEDDSGLSPDQLEACQVAHWIKSKVDGGERIEEKGGGSRAITYGDFAVLVGRNSDFDKFEEIFPRAGIPYVTFGGKGFLRRQEVTDFENLFRFLDNPKDSHSLLAVLRSPLCPLTDDLIHKVALGQIGAPAGAANAKKSKKPLWVLLTEGVKAMAGDGAGERGYSGDRQSLMQAVATLRTMLDYASLLPLGELVHKIITLTRYDLVLLASEDGKQRSRNVWKIAHLARENEHMSCGEFALNLSAMREFGMKEAEAPLDSRDAVKIMTIHASKGLEFPAVALPCLGGRLTSNPDRLIFHRSYGVAYNTKRLAEEEVPSWYQATSQLDKKMEEEERKRLLYVAMTRARDSLGLFLKQEGRDMASYRRWLFKLLGLGREHVSLPDRGQSLIISIGPSASYALSYCYGFPPLDLSQTYRTPLPQPIGPLDPLDDEPSLPPVFDSPVNELALVRLTPPAAATAPGAAGDDFALSSPRVTGTFFHALMENLPRTKKVDRDWVRDIAVNQGFHFVHPQRLETFVDEGMRLLEIYYKSDLRGLVEGAHRRFSEMPYLMDSGFGMALKRPDLIIEAADGQWYLIDYKTDKFDRTQIARQVRKHGEQLLGYARDLKRLSGIELKAALYFAQFGVLESVARSLAESGS